MFCLHVAIFEYFQVQEQAEQAKETASRAQQQIDESLKLLGTLKNRLSIVQSNDVTVSLSLT